MAWNVHLVFTVMQVALLLRRIIKIYTRFMNPLTPGLPDSITSDSQPACHLDSSMRSRASVGLNKVFEAIKTLIKEKLHIPVPVLAGLQTWKEQLLCGLLQQYRTELNRALLWIRNKIYDRQASEKLIKRRWYNISTFMEPISTSFLSGQHW